MRSPKWRLIAAVLLFSSAPGLALAKLPPLTPEQEQAAAAKKAQAAAQQEKEKQQLGESMDKIADRWRARAAKEGWKTQSPTAVSAPAGFDASAAQSSSSGQPGGKLGEDAAKAPMRSEKAGTAPPSEDVKTNKPAGRSIDKRIYNKEKPES
jgi:hypothetical protein